MRPVCHFDEGEIPLQNQVNDISRKLEMTITLKIKFNIKILV